MPFVMVISHHSFCFGTIAEYFQLVLGNCQFETSSNNYIAVPAKVELPEP